MGLEDVMNSIRGLLVSNMELMVKPEEIIAQASEVKTNVETLEQSFNDIESKIQGTSGYWVGEAGDAFRDAYSAKVGDIQDVIVRLKSYSQALEEIARNYINAENDAKSIADSLLDEIVE